MSDVEKKAVEKRLVDEAVQAIGVPAGVADAPSNPEDRAVSQEAKRPRKETLCPGLERFHERVRTMQQGLAGATPSQTEQDARADVKKAVREWLALPCEPMDTDPLTSWKVLVEASIVKPHARYLAPLALKYLVAPGASGTIERVWSDGRRVLTYGRHALSSTRFDQVVCLKRNLRSLGFWPPKCINAW